MTDETSKDPSPEAVPVPTPGATEAAPPQIGTPVGTAVAEPVGRIAKCIADARARGRHPEVAAVLAFLIPGLGHVYLGKYFKGLVAFVFLLGLYASGLFVTRGECISLDRDRGHPFAFFAQVGCGLPTGLALLRSHTAEVRKWFGGENDLSLSDDVENAEYIARLPRLDEGLLYTMIAGLLNLLLIHDALLGAPGAILRRDPAKEGMP